MIDIFHLLKQYFSFSLDSTKDVRKSTLLYRSESIDMDETTQDPKIMKCWWSVSKRLNVAQYLRLTNKMLNESSKGLFMPGHISSILCDNVHFCLHSILWETSYTFVFCMAWNFHVHDLFRHSILHYRGSHLCVIKSIQKLFGTS